MIRNSKLVVVFIVAAVLVGPSWARRGGPQAQGPTPEEIQKMEEAMPSKVVVEPAQPRKLLVIDQVTGFYHDCIPYWNKTLEIMGEKTGAFTVTFAHDVSALSADNLKDFDAICFNNTVSLPLSPDRTPELCESLMNFVKGGKGIVGIHAATDSYYARPYIWPEGSEMWGGKFTGHPWTAGRTEWAIKIDDPNHPLMASFGGKGFKLPDEIYRTEPPLYSRSKQRVASKPNEKSATRRFGPGDAATQVDASLDLSDQATGARAQKASDADTGISWIKSWGQGRIFYCSLGHIHDVTWTTPILEHYLRGIQFALGDLKADTTPLE